MLLQNILKNHLNSINVLKKLLIPFSKYCMIKVTFKFFVNVYSLVQNRIILNIKFNYDYAL